jgi:hypothetical protein
VTDKGARVVMDGTNRSVYVDGGLVLSGRKRGPGYMFVLTREWLRVGLAEYSLENQIYPYLYVYIRIYV